MAIPAIVILTSWFFKYAYVLFDHTVWGYDEPPILDVQMLNPVDEQRPLAQVAILGLIYLAVKYTASWWGATSALILTAVAAFAFPASVALLGLERNILLAVYPVAIVRIIRGLGVVYLQLLLVIAAYGVVIGLLLRWVSSMPIELALSMFGVLSVFSGLGGAVYERRNELGIETRRSPEQTAELARRAELRGHQALVTEAYGHMRTGSHIQAWSVLQDWLASRNHSLADYEWLWAHVVHWHDPRYSNRLGEEYLEKSLALKEHGRALAVLQKCLKANPAFRPKTAAASLRLAELAMQSGGLKPLARTLVGDFDTRFPGDSRIPAARALADRLTH